MRFLKANPMKLSFSILLVISIFIVATKTKATTKNYQPFTIVDNCDSIPELNKKIIAFVKTKIKKKVGNGQCWTLAQQALNSIDAKWDGLYIYGNLLNPKTDCIYPGDIIQFEKIKIEYSSGNGWYQEEMGHHTAFIYKVNAKGNYDLAHQNFGSGRKRVGITHLELKNITQGEFFIYRPTR